MDSGTTRERGDALVISVFIVVIMVGLATAMLTTSVQDSKLARVETEVMRTQYVAEAGVNHAILDLLGGGSGNIGTESDPEEFSGGTVWVVAVDNGDDTYTLTSSADVEGQQQGIEVVISPTWVSMFTMALFGDLDLGASGTVFTDSYDTDLGTYASQAVNTDVMTGVTYARPYGTLGSNGDIVLRGGVTVMGDATPGPGRTVTIIGSTVHVSGSTAPADQTTALPRFDYSPPIASAGDLSLSGANLTLTAGTYRYGSVQMSATSRITIQGDVDLYIDGNVSVTAQAMFDIAPGAKLKIHHGGGTFKVAGNGVLNQDKEPNRCVLYSRSTDVMMVGNSGLYAAIYAPDAVIDPGGTTDIFGSFVGSQIYVGGDAQFHYDEALARDPDLGFAGSYRIVSWRKVRYGSASVTPAPAQVTQ
jgi:hypothetical protein